MGEAGETYWAAIEPYWDAFDIYTAEGFRRSIAAVPDYVVHLLAVHWMSSEIYNGGLHQFFGNNTGILAPEALQGLQAMGLFEQAEIIAQAISLFPSPYPRDRKLRSRVLDTLATGPRDGTDRNTWNPFYDLDERFFAVNDVHGFEPAADTYTVQQLRRLAHQKSD